jgi:hypothetical protein
MWLKAIACRAMAFIANLLYVRNNNVSPAGGGGYIIVLIIYESAIVNTIYIKTLIFMYIVTVANILAMRVARPLMLHVIYW